MGLKNNNNMMGKEIKSQAELLENIADKERAFLLLYKKGSEQSDCSLKNLQAADTNQKDISVFMADVNEVRDIHPHYQITSVPTMIEFEKAKVVNVLKGCHKPGFYQSYFDNAVYSAKAAAADGKVQKRVTVYSTPTCSWCKTLKTHLKKHGVRFTDIDVSRDQKAAQQMQQRSGQMGVPQTDIGGQMIVGFDKTRINSLLGIQG